MGDRRLPRTNRASRGEVGIDCRPLPESLSHEKPPLLRRAFPHTELDAAKFVALVLTSTVPYSWMCDRTWRLKMQLFGVFDEPYFCSRLVSGDAIEKKKRETVNGASERKYQATLHKSPPRLSTPLKARDDCLA